MTKQKNMAERQKKVLMFFFMLFLSLSISAQSKNDPVVVSELKLVDVRIKNILNRINLAIEEGDGKSEKVFVIRSRKKTDYFELRFSVLHENDFSWFLLDKKDKLRGCFSYKNKNVLVFGDDNNLFKASGHFKSFDFIRLKADQNEIVNNEPPIIFEPLVWIYNIRKANINFIEKGRYYLLD